MSKVTWIVYIIFYSFYVHSMIHVELAFVKVVRSVSRSFFFWHVDVQLFQHHWLKRLSFLYYSDFTPLPKFSSLFLCGSVSGLTLYSVPLICLFFHQYHPVLMPVASQLVLKWGSGSCPTLFFSFNTVMGILDLLPLHIKFRISLSTSKKYFEEFLLGLQ